MSGRTDSNRVDSLPGPVVALLRAVHDTLDLPLPGLTDADERAYARLVVHRARDARVILAGVLDDGHEAGRAALSLRAWVDREPVTYTPWTDERGAR
ncbi:hypothetical protein [Streptomyces indiaensis]|uniref:Uncharacterized protein n=1 Tax=Streptomyces indiaensis TaxID=284033 RepID=A0ABP5Q1M4_9ACTN|nr:hypothetical protein [Streptomyces indiaensis]MCF1645501.1 hypothetical protein [Streptomyces indiaensis]